MDQAIAYLLKEKLISKKDSLIAVNDKQKEWREIPVMEIIDLGQL